MISVPVSTVDACVPYDLPCATVVIPDTVGVVTATGMGISCPEIVSDNLCRSFSCKPRKLYLDSEFLILKRIFHLFSTRKEPLIRKSKVLL